MGKRRTTPAPERQWHPLDLAEEVRLLQVHRSMTVPEAAAELGVSRARAYEALRVKKYGGTG